MRFSCHSGAAGRQPEDHHGIDSLRHDQPMNCLAALLRFCRIGDRANVRTYDRCRTALIHLSTRHLLTRKLLVESAIRKPHPAPPPAAHYGSHMVAGCATNPAGTVKPPSPNRACAFGANVLS